MKNTIIAFLSGALAVTILGCVLLLKKVKPTIITDQYVEKLQQRIGKIKQRGEGNAQQVDQKQDVVTGKEKRMIKKAGRKARRNHKKPVLSKADEKSEV